MKKIYSPHLFLVFLSLLMNVSTVFSQGGTCADIAPFCAGNQALIFANCNNVDPDCTPTAEPGPDYDCLFSQPYPAWFYLQVDQAGQLDFQITQNTSFDVNGNPTGTGLDVDFIAWGPFAQGDDLCDYTQLQSFNQIACSYSIDPVENFTIPNAQPGEIYVLVITNYGPGGNSLPGFIKLEQTNAGTGGAGSTDCSILTTQTGCQGEQFTLDATSLGAINYLWEFDDGTGFVTIYDGNFPTIDVTAAGDYRVTITFNVGIPQTKEFQIVTYPQPIIASPPQDISMCDNGTGQGIFDLTQNDGLVRGSQDPSFSITYHHSQLEAVNGSNPITPANAYSIVGSSEVIWVRIEDPSGNCYAIDSFTITFATATATPPAGPFYICDQDENGQESINLVATFNSTILNGQSPFSYRVTYHDNPGDAATGNNPLSNPYNVITSPMTIYARVESISDPNCFATTQFDIILDVPPAVNHTPEPLVVCDGDNDGYAPFDLHLADGDITLGDGTLTVTYHPTQSDAENGLNELLAPYTNDDPYDDVVFARIESPLTSCYATVELLLEVRDSPVLTVPAPLRLCDDDADGLMVFDLTSRAGEILGGLDPALYDIYYYVLELDAIAAGDAALAAPDFSGAIGNPGAYPNLTNPQTVYVLVVGNGANTLPHNGGAGCYDIVPLELVVDPLPVPVQALPYELCDDTVDGSTPTDQKSTFDLTTRRGEITGGDLSLTLTWYETPADELADIPIADPTAYQNRAIPPAPLNPQTVVARVTNGFGCSTTTTLTLVVNPLPAAVAPAPLEVCDDNGDGFALFDLTDKDDEITAGDPGLTVRYYTTRGLAEIGSPLDQILGLYANDAPYNDIVWARVENGGTGCYAIVELALVVTPRPDAPTAGFGDLTSCDPDGGGSADFDLTLNAPFVYGAQTVADFTLTYHTNPIDANSGANPILGPGSFPSSGQTIYVRLEDNLTGCSRISSFDLIVGEFPSVVAPGDMELCDDLESGSGTDGVSIFDLTLNDAVVTGGDLGLTVRYYADLADQQSDDPIADPTAYANPVDANGQGISPYTVYVSVLNGTGCRATTTLTLVVRPLPVATVPTPLVVCDVDNDGFALFDLTDKNDEITAGAAGVGVSYHETLGDARAGAFPLADPYENIVAYSQTLYVRVAFAPPPSGTGCYTVVELDLEVSPTPVVPLDLPDLVLCDPDGDGRAEFDLTVQRSLIYGAQDPTDLTLTYHTSLAAADAGTGAIAVPDRFTNTANPQTIWVRLENDITGCYKVGEFDLVVSVGLAVNDPTPLERCDDLGEANDGRTVFDLTEKNAEITGGIPSADVGYYLSQRDALDDVDRIAPDTAYGNTSNPQVLYVRVADSDTGCLSYTTLTLRVLPNPDPEQPDGIALCDVDNPLIVGPDVGVERFDLTVREAQILDGESWTLDYYESYADAVSETGPIPDPAAYDNTSSPQIIYVRVTKPDSGCFEIVELELTVSPLPDGSAVVSPFILCEIGSDGRGIFDLTEKIAEILGGQSADDFTVSFYLDANDAASGTNALLDAGAHQNRDAAGNTENPQTIYTGIADNASGCYVGGDQSFELVVQEDAVATAPTAPFVICDNLPPSDGIAEFDLEDFGNQAVVDLRAGILSGQDPATYSLEFYETQENAMAGTAGAISFPYTNTINPQVVYARVTNEADLYAPKCFAVVEVVLKVEELPQLLLDGDYRLCVDANGNPIAEEDGGTSPPVIDTGLDPSLYTFEWQLDGVVLPGETGPSILALQGGEYTVVVTETATGCDVSASVTVAVSGPPTAYGAVLVNGAFAESHVIEATAEGLGDYVFQLDDGPFQDSGTFGGVSPGAHTVTIRDANGCGSVTIDVGVIDYPPYFTPNGDGYHDTWNIIGIAGGDPTAKIYIFDRFGKLLKQLSPLGNGWDGTYAGSPLPSSDYWFRVDYTEEGAAKQFKGHFTLKR